MKVGPKTSNSCWYTAGRFSSPPTESDASPQRVKRTNVAATREFGILNGIYADTMYRVPTEHTQNRMIENEGVDYL